MEQNPDPAKPNAARHTCRAALLPRQTEAENSDILDRHRPVAWAIADRNPEEVQRCMAAHFDEAIGSLLRR